MFKYDLFISYAHLDNEPDIPDAEGWVKYFHYTLEKRLTKRLGREANIFRDAELQKFGKFSDQLAKALSDSAALVSVISPRYVQAKWCLRELREFYNQANVDRIIKVVKTAYDKKDLACFEITEQCLASLKPEGVPADVLEKLQPIKNRKVRREESFLTLLKTTIGEEQTAEFKSLILKQARDPEEDAEALFGQIKDVLEVRFYKENEMTKRFDDLQPEIRKEDIPEFFEMVDSLAQDIVTLLKNLSASNPTAPVADSPASTPPPPAIPDVALPSVSSASPAPSTASATPAAAPNASDRNLVVVYLAQATQDLAEERRKIKSELEQFDYRVLPDQPLPQEISADELTNVINGYLRQAKLSVHLIGEKYGARPEGDDRSIPHIQYDLAAAMSKEGALAQLVWIPNGLEPKEEGQSKFVQDVKANSPDFLQTKFEDLKTEIKKKLEPGAPDSWNDVEGEPVNVCLFCHEQDAESIKPLFTHLKLNEAFKVKLPLKDAQSLESHKQILQSSDAILLYYGTGDEDWFANIWRLIQRHSSSGRTKPILAKAIYAGQPAVPEKDMLDSDDPLVLKNYGEFTPAALAPFVEKIRAAKGGAK
jgi:hypothetical protein